ncbi:HAD-like protein [Acinetobacter phage vB_AbaM_DLP1]|nr:HAD-like protein [Acinetobacter phage vB_AbaM_DLP1]
MTGAKHFCFDIDNTITIWNDDRDYENFEPDLEMVEMINSLYDQGHHITLFTARGMTSVGSDAISRVIIPPLVKNLEKIKLKYHHLITHKPVYDWIIDDKAMNPREFKDAFLKNELLSKQPYTPKVI